MESSGGSFRYYGYAFLLVIGAMLGYIITASLSSYSMKPGAFQKDSEFFAKQFANIPESTIESVSATSITFKKDDDTQEFSVAEGVQIYQYSIDPALAPPPSTDVRSLIRGSRVFTNLELINGKYQVINITVLPNP